MTEFYNKYKRLFTEADHTHKNQSAIANFNNYYKTPNNNPLNRFFENRDREGVYRKQQKIGRSPALDEFEHYILPRLKTEPDAVDRYDKKIMHLPLSSPYSGLPSISFESKPHHLIDVKRQEAKYHLNNPKKLQYQENFNNNSNKKYTYPSIKAYNYNLQSIKQQIINQPKLVKAPQAIVYTKRTRNFTTTETNQVKQAVQSAKKVNKHTNIYEPQLYGLNQNPYAFANSKLSDIKLIQRFYPRGIINKYKACLHRRHQKKGQLGQRRQRLRLLLQKDTDDYKSARK